METKNTKAIDLEILDKIIKMKKSMKVETVKINPKIINVAEVYVNNDCTVKTLSTSLRVTYDFAKLILQQFYPYNLELKLSKKRTKLEFSMITNVRMIYDSLFELIGTGGNLHEVLNLYPEGEFVAIVKGHTFFIKDKVVYDSISTELGTPIEYLYRVDKIEKLQTMMSKIISSWGITPMHNAKAHIERQFINTKSTPEELWESEKISYSYGLDNETSIVSIPNDGLITLDNNEQGQVLGYIDCDNTMSAVVANNSTYRFNYIPVLELKLRLLTMKGGELCQEK